MARALEVWPVSRRRRENHDLPLLTSGPSRNDLPEHRLGNHHQSPSGASLARNG
jgi:hypothetical protein